LSAPAPTAIPMPGSGSPATRTDTTFDLSAQGPLSFHENGSIPANLNGPQPAAATSAAPPTAGQHVLLPPMNPGTLPSPLPQGELPRWEFPGISELVPHAMERPPWAYLPTLPTAQGLMSPPPLAGQQLSRLPPMLQQENYSILPQSQRTSTFEPRVSVVSVSSGVDPPARAPSYSGAAQPSLAHIPPPFPGLHSTLLPDPSQPPNGGGGSLGQPRPQVFV